MRGKRRDGRGSQHDSRTAEIIKEKGRCLFHVASNSQLTLGTAQRDSLEERDATRVAKSLGHRGGKVPAAFGPIASATFHARARSLVTAAGPRWTSTAAGILLSGYWQRSCQFGLWQLQQRPPSDELMQEESEWRTQPIGQGKGRGATRKGSQRYLQGIKVLASCTVVRD